MYEMDTMSSSVALQKQIASIMDELSKAALMEISKVVDDGVVMLKLEICEREHEIESLKRNLQMVSEELRQTRRALVRQCVGTGRSGPLAKGAKDKCKTASEKDVALRNEDLSLTSEGNKAAPSGVVVKLESMDEEQAIENKNQHPRTEPDLQTAAADDQPDQDVEIRGPRFFSSQHLSDRAAMAEQDYDALEDRPEAHDLNGEEECSADPQDDLLRAQNDAGISQSHSYTHNTLVQPPPDCQGDFGPLALAIASRGRPMVGMGLEKRRFACAFCIKSFDRLSHLDRHQRIHTGEKPFSCMLCGRSFTQKSSLKSHLKTHRGFTGDLEAAAILPQENNLFGDEWNMAAQCEEQVTHQFDQSTDEQNSHSSYLGQESTRFMNVDDESLQGTHVDQVMGNTLTRQSNFPAGRRKSSAERFELEDVENEDQMLDDCRLVEPRHPDSGSDSIMDDGDAGAHSSNAASFGKDSESDCLEIAERSPMAPTQNQRRFDCTSTVLHSWRSGAANQVHVKQEEDDDISHFEEDADEPYVIQSDDLNSISPLDQGSIADSLRTMEASEGLDLSNDLTPRRRRAFNGRERRFLCVLCGKSFDRLSHLDRHQRIHTGEKPYSCGTCGRSFTQKSSLKGHMRTHTGERGFSCSLCGMSFPTRASQCRHHCN